MALITTEELLRRIQVERENEHGNTILREQIRYPPMLSDDPARPPDRHPDVSHLTNKSVAIYYASSNTGQAALEVPVEIAYNIWHESKYPTPEYDNFLSQTIVYAPRVARTTGASSICPVDVSHVIPDILRAHERLCFETEQKLQDTTTDSTLLRIRPIFKSVILVVLNEPDTWGPDRTNLRVLVVKTGFSNGTCSKLDLHEIGSRVRGTDNPNIMIAPLRDALQWISDMEDADIDLNGCPLLERTENFAWDGSFYALGDPSIRITKAGWEYSGPKITPTLLLQHRDRTVYPNHLYRLTHLSCPGRLALLRVTP